MPSTGPIGVVHREARHSNESRTEDRRTLRRVVGALRARGFTVAELEAARAAPSALRDVALLLTMERNVDALRRLEGAVDAPIVNRPQATISTLRHNLYPALAAMGAPMPPTVRCDLRGPEPLPRPYWLKRRDYHHLCSGDVTLVRSGADWARAASHLRRQGHNDAFAQRHAKGPTVKFYCVCDRYTRDVRLLRTVDEVGVTTGLRLRELAQQLAATTDLEVFGGDVIVDHGQLWLVDVNGWPSFRSCHDEAAEAIADYAGHLLKGHRSGRPAEVMGQGARRRRP